MLAVKGLLQQQKPSIKNDSDFGLLYQTISKKVERIDHLNESVSPRKRRWSNPAVRERP